MPKITFIGAGSFGFTRRLVRDVLTFPLLRDSTISLMDIDPERLDFAYRAVSRIVEAAATAKVEATLDRAKLWRARMPYCALSGRPVSVWRRQDPKSTGRHQRGRYPAAGIFRALRTIPVMLDIVKDMERLCPKAIFLNYTNPWPCSAGPCSGVVHTPLWSVASGHGRMLASWIGAPMDEITTLRRHQSPVVLPGVPLEGRDAYRCYAKPSGIYNHEIVGTSCSSSPATTSQSLAVTTQVQLVVRKRRTSSRSTASTAPAGTRVSTTSSIATSTARIPGATTSWVHGSQQPDRPGAGPRYAAYIINAYLGGEPWFNGNVPNKGIITNLPPDVCVGRSMPTGTG